MRNAESRIFFLHYAEDFLLVGTERTIAFARVPCVSVPCVASFFKRKVLAPILSIRAAARILKPCFIKFLYFFSSLFMAVPLASGTVYLSKFKWVFPVQNLMGRHIKQVGDCTFYGFLIRKKP